MDWSYNPGEQAPQSSNAKYYSKFSGFVVTFFYCYFFSFALLCV